MKQSICQNCKAEIVEIAHLGLWYTLTDQTNAGSVCYTDSEGNLIPHDPMFD